MALVFALVVVVLERTRVGLLSAGLLVGVTVLTMAPWVARYAVVTGRPSLYNESPISNLILMGTWFRVFDEQTFSELQRIETSALSRDEARAEASRVGPRPELSVRYIEQVRGPYERPLDETLALAADNVRLNLRQYADQSRRAGARADLGGPHARARRRHAALAKLGALRDLGRRARAAAAGDLAGTPRPARRAHRSPEPERPRRDRLLDRRARPDRRRLALHHPGPAAGRADGGRARRAAGARRASGWP